ncbi:hypothetical protein GCM10010217_72220 [Streptomyces tubercidicus]
MLQASVRRSAAGAAGFCRAGSVVPLAWAPDIAHARASAFDRFNTCVSQARPRRTTWTRPGCSVGIGIGLASETSMR